MENILIFIPVAIAYFIPTYIACKKDIPVQRKKIIFLLNFFGFTGVLWAVAFIWAVMTGD